MRLGYQFYGSGRFGGADPRAASYLPVIHAPLDDLTLLHVQDYNRGPVTGLDDQFHTMGVADFHVAMTDMLLAGFFGRARSRQRVCAAARGPGRHRAARQRQRRRRVHPRRRGAPRRTA